MKAYNLYIIIELWRTTMDSEWMGRYRNLVAALVQHSNIVMKASSEKAEVSRGIFLNPNEWQILEYLVEHRDHTLIFHVFWGYRKVLSLNW